MRDVFFFLRDGVGTNRYQIVRGEGDIDILTIFTGGEGGSEQYCHIHYNIDFAGHEKFIFIII